MYGYKWEQVAKEMKQNGGQGDHGSALRLYGWDARSKHKSESSHLLLKSKNDFIGF